MPHTTKKLQEPNLIFYKGFEIQVFTHRLASPVGWCFKITLYKHKGEKVIRRSFTPDMAFATQREAIKGGFKFGEDIIDGKNPKISIKRLNK